ncbi:hypothetical protein B0H63DRAFT_464493 [Podospora didyma]|uniref:Nephrocystin 3-like N-terminal domain-containing protein n=1 Tax=Podospora didyma TaxID=330526 RepID=A0AAE0NYE0_9PEZI|nr:hypothetical protein B0H63DRAFT_464493 [Podospora didyma]
MDPFSVSVGIIGIVSAVKGCLKLANKHVGASAISSEEAEALMKSLYELNGATRNFQMHQELNDDDDDLMASYECLQPVIKRSLEAAQMVKEFLQNNSKIAKAFRGVKFDKKLKVALKSLDEATKLFNMAILADQQTILVGVKNYVEKMTDDIHDIQTGQLEAQQENSYREVRSWLDAQADNNTNSQRHEYNRLNRRSGTCEWLFRHEAFQEWLRAKDAASGRMLWLKCSPGAGKSFLCSTAIDHVTSELHDPCLYYFYQFDDKGTSGSSDGGKSLGITVAAILVDQLCRYFWRRDRGSIAPVAALVETAEMNFTTLAEIVRILVKFRTENPQGQGAVISTTTKPTLYLFLDGLDEAQEQEPAHQVLAMFQCLESEFPIMIKVWIGSRDTSLLRQRLEHCSQINIDEHSKVDVQEFIRNTIPKLDSGPEEGHKIEGKLLDDWILDKLQDRAKGNFLYAKLMVERLKDDVLNIDDIMTLVRSKVPNNFAEIYRRIFLQYGEDQRKYISLLFSIITFARRPMRLSELQEAMTLALSDRNKGLDPLRAPRSLSRLFGPLIQEQQDVEEPGNPLCRLCHATVYEFLMSNPDVLRSEGTSQAPFVNTISAARVADLCLRYLAQRRYSLPIQPSKPTNLPAIAENSFDDAQQYGLLSYCAKYWDRHMDDLNGSDELRAEVRAFIKSPNYQTLLQVQSLFVSAHFAQFKLLGAKGSMFRRVFPKWFGPDRSETDYIYRTEYRHFISEWGYLLERGSCTLTDEHHRCKVEHFLGEVDRCLVGLLGPTHFMNGMKERYPSFMLVSDNFDYHASEQLVLAEGLSLCQSKFTVISSFGKDQDLTLKLETYDLSPDKIHHTNASSLVPTLGLDFSAATAQPVYLSSRANTFKLGSCTFDTHDVNHPVILDKHTEGRFGPISTDFDKRGDIIVVASRNVHERIRKKETTKPPIPGSRKPATNLNAGAMYDSEPSSDDDGYGESDDDISDENSAEESCSDGSIDTDSSNDSDSETDSDAGENSTDEDTDSDSEDSDTSDEETKSPANFRVVINPQTSGNAAEFGSDPLKRDENKRPSYPGMPDRYRLPTDQIRASIAVYSIASGQAVRLFHYDHLIKAMLYHSPPMLHPSKPLVIWPMGGGDILFADYDDNTFFIRKSMPTTRKTRHICMKPQFSPCGKFFHIASLEGRVAKGQQRPDAAIPRSSKYLQKELVLSVFVTTYRLSEHKTTRSPPQLIHKTKVNLGQFAGLSLAKLPITFTWQPEHVFFSVTGCRLNVYRVSLFKPPPGANIPAVVVPRLSVMLPLSAIGRQVHYIPPKSPNSTRGVVLMGSYGGHTTVQLKARSANPRHLGMGDQQGRDALPYPCPPIGFYVDEERNLGGWVPAKIEVDDAVVNAGREQEERLSNGRLVRKVEYFDWDDDVDLEGICENCNAPLFFSR